VFGALRDGHDKITEVANEQKQIVAKELDDVHSRLERVEKGMEALKEENIALEKENDALKEDKKAVEDNVSSADSEKIDLAKQIEILRAEVSHTADKHAADLADVKSKLEQTEKGLSRAEQSRDTAISETAKTEESLKKQLQDDNKSEEDVAQLGKELETARGEVKSLTQQIGEAMRKTGEAQGELQSKEKQFQSKIRENSDLQEKLSAYHEDLETAQNELTSCQEALKASQKQHMTCQDNLKKSATIGQNSVIQNDGLVKQIEHLGIELKQLKNEKKKIEDVHDQTKQALKEEQDKLGEVSTEKQSDQNTPRVERDAISQKEQELEKMKNDSETQVSWIDSKTNPMNMKCGRRL
jgi:chromosome segregation ATPase